MTLSPWHLLGLGLLSLIGTGVVAAIERSQERAAAAQAETHAPQTIATATAGPERVPEPRRAAAAPAPQTATLAKPAASGAGASPPFSAQPANVAPAPAAPPVRTAGDPGRPAALFLMPPAQVAAQAVGPAAARPAQPASDRKQATGDGPLVTASLTPAIAPPTAPARPALAPAPQSAAPGALKTTAAAPTECLPGELRAVLADVTARFGNVTVVSTHRLNTVNHSAGSIREKLHHDCKAVDVSVDRSRIEEIKAYLKGRREIGGLESYRNGVIHMDVSGVSIASTRVRPGMTTRRTSVAEVPPDAMQAPANPPQPTPAAPALPDRASGGDN